MRESSIDDFWARARAAVPTLPAAVPEAWAFGATTTDADELLSLVLDGTKTGTASSLRDVEAEDEVLPEAGQLSVILDGSDLPRAAIMTTAVELVPFDQVSVEHAYSEGEGNRSLATWRAIHESFWREHGQSPSCFSADLPIVCERFELIHAERD